MRRLAWLTDVHLNFVTPRQVDTLCGEVLETGADTVLLGGDIGEATSVVELLEGMDARLGLPIDFVLGNHDFYGGSVARVRKGVEALCSRIPRLHWLPRSGVVELTPETGLVGHDGWADGRFGDYTHSDVVLNDYLLIEELAGQSARNRLDRLHTLGDEAANHFRTILPGALRLYRRLIVLTHVPPFREACWHMGRISDDNWLPHFSCKAVGEALVEAMTAHPGCEMTVLCGHTHSPGEAQILPNLKVLTGGAEYRKPSVQQVLEVD